MKRAIALAGGGPAAGLHIGVLEALRKENIKFDVWALSCIGAWVGIVYNQCDAGREVEQTYDFFRNGVFRDDESYERFPVNTVFGPDWFGATRALMEFVSKWESYDQIWLPHRMMDSVRETMSMMFDRRSNREQLLNKDPRDIAVMLIDRLSDHDKWFKKWDEGDINQWVLNQVMAPNPFIRYLTSMMYLSNVTGLSKIHYPESNFMKAIKFDRLYEKGKPFIFHNAWNLTQKELVLFANQKVEARQVYGEKVEERLYRRIDAASLCACSALPFIEETVKIDGDTYCEGALVDTVNFKRLLEDHPDLDEIWVSRIVDADQIREPKNVHDALANLCQLFAATVGEDDVKLFKYHVQYDALKNGKKWKGTVVEIQVSKNINFKWNHSNLDHGREEGKAAAKKACMEYRTAGEENRTGKVRFINEKAEEDEKGESYNEDQMAKAIAQAKGKRDPKPYLAKMKWRVDGKTGKEVLPNDKGEFPEGSIPYAAFAARNAKVKEAYDQLTGAGSKLDDL
jgi:predicted acylesterase/phospholipase RssA